MNERHNISIDSAVWKAAFIKARKEARYLSKIIELLLIKWLNGEIDLE